MGRVSAIFLCAALCACAVLARGGDGGDYSGDGSSSGSDYGSSSSDYSSGSSDYGSSDYDYGDGEYSGGDNDFVGLMVILVVFGIAIGATVVGKYNESRSRKQLRNSGQLRQPRAPVSLDRLLVRDPNFSPVVFEAFAHLVYVKYHESRGGMARRSAEEFAVSPYLSKSLRKAVQKSDETIAQVIVGHMKIDSVHFGERTRVDVSFKSNVVYKDHRGKLSRMVPW